MFQPTDKYRFGSDVHGWVGQRYKRRYKVFNEPSDKDAWNEGRRRWFRQGPRSGGCLLGLERQYIVPPTKLLSGVGIDHSDREPQKTIWLRVAVGYPESGWEGGPEGGVSIEVEGGTGKISVSLWGETEQDLFDSPFMQSVNDKTLLRFCIRSGLDRYASSDRRDGSPVWVQYTENKTASDTHPTFQVCATPALWRTVLDRLENSDD